MSWIIETVLMLGIAVLSLKIGKSLLAKHRAEPSDEDSYFVGWGLRLLGIGLIVAWLLLTAFSSVWQISAGHVGVVYRFNNIVGQKKEGLQFIAPWENMKIATTRVQSKQFIKLAAFSKETQDVFVDATLNFSIAPEDIQHLYRTVGPDWYEKLVPPRVRQTLKDTTVKYTTVEVAPNREQIRKIVRERLQEQLAQFSINVEDFLLDNIEFRPEFKQAIEDKQIATQEAQTQENLVKAAQFKAEQAIKTAQGQAKANSLVSKSLTTQIIQYTAIQKLNPNVQVMLVPAGSNFILPGSLLESKK